MADRVAPLSFQTPHLVNLNEDPLMSECLLYYIKEGVTRSDASCAARAVSEGTCYGATFKMSHDGGSNVVMHFNYEAPFVEHMAVNGAGMNRTRLT